MTDPRIPDETNPETKPFWDAAREDRFVLRRCGSCGRTHWYPRAVCPHCFSPGTEWVEAKRTGRIYSFTVFRPARAPDVLAYVTLDEGPVMLTNIVDADPDTLEIGQAVELVFRQAEQGPPLPVFRPV